MNALRLAPLTPVDRTDAGPALDHRDRDRLVSHLVEVNMGVAGGIAARYSGRGIELEDLRQVAYLALVKSARRYDATSGHEFLSYAVPTIRGEIRRHFRDHGWMVRPPRRIQELQGRIAAEQSRLASTLGRTPRPPEVAEHLRVRVEDVIEALSADGCFTPSSLDRPVGDAGSTPLGELLPDDDRHPAAAEARVVLDPVVRRLGERDRHVLMLRFFHDCTQQEIANDIGVTQTQVSRLLTRILAGLRRDLLDPLDVPAS